MFISACIVLAQHLEQLRHTYLRVLDPLLTKTQLRNMPYKRAQIVQMLESLIEHENIREINPTTKRLVQRCLSGEWCVQYRKPSVPKRASSPGVESVSSTSSLPASSSSRVVLSATSAPEPEEGKIRGLKSSRSVENLKAPAKPPRTGRAWPLGEGHRSGSNDSSVSLPRVAAAEAVPPSTKRRDRAGSMDAEVPAASHQERRHHILDDTVAYTQEPPEIRVISPASGSSSDLSVQQSMPPSPLFSSSAPVSPVPRQRRSAPAPPPRRRKPPAIPTLKSPNGVTITTIASSSQSALTPRPRKGLIYQAVA